MGRDWSDKETRKAEAAEKMLYHKDWQRCISKARGSDVP